MRALLLRDAVQRLAAGAALGVALSAWLWRSWPPWEVRAWLWGLDGVPALAAALGVPLAWALLCTPVIRILLRSARLEYWRQFPISRAQWIALHAVHLACIDAPAIGIAIYLLAPLAEPWRIAAAAVAALAVVVAAQVALAQVEVPRVPVWLRSRTAVGALWRLHAITVLRRDRSAVWLTLAVQILAVGYAVVGVANVAREEPQAAWSLLHGGAIAGSFAAAWLVLRAQRAIDRDRWYLDALPGVRPSTELLARVLVGATFATPTIVGLGLAAAPLGVVDLVAAGLHALVAAGWAAAGFTRIGARAEAHARLGAPQSVPTLVLVVYGACVLVLVGPLALLFAAALELALAHRALARATALRTRFETTNRQDDHG
jgi:hypothetical protein